MTSLAEQLESERTRVARALARLDAAQSAQLAAESRADEFELRAQTQARLLADADARTEAAQTARHADAAEARAVLAKWKAAFERELSARDDEAERKLAAAQRLLDDALAHRQLLDSRLQAATAELHVLKRTASTQSASAATTTAASAAAVTSVGPPSDQLQLQLRQSQAELRDSMRQVASLNARLDTLSAQRDAATADAAAAADARAHEAQLAAHAARERDRAAADAKAERARADAAESELARLRHALAAAERAAATAAAEASVTRQRWAEQAERELAAARADDAAKLAAVAQQRDKALADLRAAERRAGATATHQTDVAERLAVLDEQFAAWRVAANERESQLKQQLAVVASGEAAVGAHAQIESLQRLVRDERRRAEALAVELDSARAAAADNRADNSGAELLLAQWRVKFEGALASAAAALEQERRDGAAALERERSASAAALQRERVAAAAATSAAAPHDAMQRLADNVEALQLRINAYRDELEFVAQERDAALREMAALREARAQDDELVDELESAREEQDALRRQLGDAQQHAERVEADARALLQQWREKFERELEWASERGSQRPKRLVGMLASVQEQLSGAFADRDRSVELRKAAQRDAEQATARHAAAAAELAELAPQLDAARAHLRGASERIAELERVAADADAARVAAVQAAQSASAELVAQLEASVSRLEIDVEVRELRIGELVDERELAAVRAREAAEACERLEEELAAARAAIESDVPRDSERALADELNAERAARRADAAEARALLQQWHAKFVDALQSHKDAVVMRQQVLKRLAERADENVDNKRNEEQDEAPPPVEAEEEAAEEKEAVLPPLHEQMMSRIRSVLQVTKDTVANEGDDDDDDKVEQAAKKRRRAKSAGGNSRRKGKGNK